MKYKGNLVKLTYTTEEPTRFEGTIVINNTSHSVSRKTYAEVFSAFDEIIEKLSSEEKIILR